MANENIPLKEQIRLAIAKQDANASFELRKKVDELIDSTGQGNSNEKRTLLKIKSILTFLSSRFISQKALIDLFEHNIVDITSAPDEVDLKSVVQYRLLTESFNEDRNLFRDALKSAILRSDQELGDEKIQLGTNEVAPTVSNWMKVFAANVGLEQISSVQLAKFFSQNEQYQKLLPQEKVAFKKIIDLYQYLTLRSDTLEGYEDYVNIETPDNKLLRVGGGEIIDYYSSEELNRLEKLAEKKLLSVGQLVDLQYRFPDRFNKFKPEQQAPKAENINPTVFQQQMDTYFEQLRETYESKASTTSIVDASVKQFLEDLLDPSAPQMTLSSVKQELVQLVQNPKNFVKVMQKKAVMDFILQYFPQELGEKNKMALEQGGFSPLALEAFLRIVLKQGFNLSEEEAKWHAFTVIQRFPLTMKDYKTLVTYDLNNNELIWRYQ